MTRRHFILKMLSALVVLSGGCTRKTAWPVQGSQKGSVRLVFYSDVHARTEWEIPAAMARAADAMNFQRADLVVAGGDLINNGLHSSATQAAPRWDAYMAMQRTIKGDLYPVMGNHDLVAGRPADGSPPARDPRAVYRTRMGLERTYYAFDAVGYHFVMLDSVQLTNDDFYYRGMIGPAQLDWLQRDLGRVPRGTPIVLVTHVPLLTAFYGAVEGFGFSPPKNRVVVNNVKVLELIANHNVILVLQGHLHVKEMIQWRGTTFITGGAVCGKWWRGPWYGTQEGFNTLTLTGDHVRWEYVDYGWEAQRPVQG